MDPLLAADRLPKLAERAMRDAIVAELRTRRRLFARVLVDDALLRFEREVARVAPDGVRPVLLFGLRDRIVREMRGFIESRVAARLFAVERRNVVALGAAATPFDALLRGRHGGTYAVLLRRVPADRRSLERFQAIVRAAEAAAVPLNGVVLYDFGGGPVRLVRCHDGSLAAAS